MIEERKELDQVSVSKGEPNFAHMIAGSQLKSNTDLLNRVGQFTTTRKFIDWWFNSLVPEILSQDPSDTAAKLLRLGRATMESNSIDSRSLRSEMFSTKADIIAAARKISCSISFSSQTTRSLEGLLVEQLWFNDITDYEPGLYYLCLAPQLLPLCQVEPEAKAVVKDVGNAPYLDGNAILTSSGCITTFRGCR